MLSTRADGVSDAQVTQVLLDSVSGWPSMFRTTPVLYCTLLGIAQLQFPDPDVTGKDHQGLQWRSQSDAYANRCSYLQISFKGSVGQTFFAVVRRIGRWLNMELYTFNIWSRTRVHSAGERLQGGTLGVRVLLSRIYTYSNRYLCCFSVHCMHSDTDNDTQLSKLYSSPISIQVTNVTRQRVHKCHGR